MRFKTLDDFNFKGKRVLLRLDLNSAIINNKIELTDRIIEHSKTVKELIKKKAKVVILTHQGRPGQEDFTSLKQHSKLLNKFVKVKFVPDILGKKAIATIKNLKDGQAILLENVRYLKEEGNLSINNRLAKLSSLFDIYINDAFSVCHRSSTSITIFPKLLPSGIGRLLEQELNGLKKIHLSKRPIVYILAGAKPEDNILLLNNKPDFIIAAGLFGQFCLMSLGHNLGAQNKYIEKKGYKPSKHLANLVKKYKVILPEDFAVKINNKRKDIPLENFPVDYEIFDIGPKTRTKFVQIIRKAKTIFIKGPVGAYEEKQFSIGTKAILNAIANNKKAFSFVGGGNTSDAIKHLNIKKNKFSHISLAGGALLDYLAGKKLPGLEALKKR